MDYNKLFILPLSIINIMGLKPGSKNQNNNPSKSRKYFSTKGLKKTLLTGFLTASTTFTTLFPYNTISQENYRNEIKPDGEFTKEDIGEIQEDIKSMEEDRGILERALEIGDGLQIPGADIASQQIDSARTGKAIANKVHEMGEAIKEGKEIRFGSLILRPEEKKGLPKPEKLEDYLFQPDMYKDNAQISYAEYNPCKAGDKDTNPRKATKSELKEERNNGNWPGITNATAARFNKSGVKINQYILEFLFPEIAEEYISGEIGRILPKSASEIYLLQGGEDGKKVSKIYFMDRLSDKEKEKLSSLFMVYKERTDMELKRHIVRESSDQERKDKEKESSNLEEKLLGKWETVKGNQGERGTISFKENSINFKNIKKLNTYKWKIIQSPEGDPEREPHYKYITNTNPKFIDFISPIGESPGKNKFPVKFLEKDIMVLDARRTEDENSPEFSDNPLILNRIDEESEKSQKEGYTKEDLYGTWKIKLDKKRESFMILSKNKIVVARPDFVGVTPVDYHKKEDGTLSYTMYPNGQKEVTTPPIDFINSKEISIEGKKLTKVSENHRFPEDLPSKEIKQGHKPTEEQKRYYKKLEKKY